MATWVTHLMIADRVLEALPQLDARGFCVGSIAPDCNVENADWTAFTPPREVTHFMSGERKTAADSERFWQEWVEERSGSLSGAEELSFLMGYYAHLIADAEFQRMITDEARVAAMWRRFDADEQLRKRSQGMEKTWVSAKKLFSRSERFAQREVIEAEYLQAHPESGYLTHILTLQRFPDYLDFMPKGCIVRKIGVMGDLPRKDLAVEGLFCISREEYLGYVETTAKLVIGKLHEKMQHPLLTAALPLL